MPLDLFAAKRLSDQTQNGDICRHFGRTSFLALRTQACSPRCVIAGALSPHMSLKARKYPWGSAPSPMRGYYTLALPCYLFIAHSNARFVKESRRKNLQGVAFKIFRALDNGGKLHN